MEVTPTPLANLMNLATYQARTAHIFPGVESLRWFVRQHRKEIAKARAVLKISGRHLIDPSKFDACVLEIATAGAPNP